MLFTFLRYIKIILQGIAAIIPIVLIISGMESIYIETTDTRSYYNGSTSLVDMVYSLKPESEGSALFWELPVPLNFIPPEPSRRFNSKFILIVAFGVILFIVTILHSNKEYSLSDENDSLRNKYDSVEVSNKSLLEKYGSTSVSNEYLKRASILNTHVSQETEVRLDKLYNIIEQNNKLLSWKKTYEQIGSQVCSYIVCNEIFDMLSFCGCMESSVTVFGIGDTDGKFISLKAYGGKDRGKKRPSSWGNNIKLKGSTRFDASMFNNYTEGADVRVLHNKESILANFDELPQNGACQYIGLPIIVRGEMVYLLQISVNEEGFFGKDEKDLIDLAHYVFLPFVYLIGVSYEYELLLESYHKYIPVPSCRNNNSGDRRRKRRKKKEKKEKKENKEKKEEKHLSEPFMSLYV